MRATPHLIGRRGLLAGSAAMISAPYVARAAEPVKLVCITTLSTPAGYIGEDCRDAFALAIQQEHGTLGGVPVELVVEDDGLKPALAKQAADRQVQAGARIFSGIIFSNVLEAAMPGVVAKDAFFISSNPAPATLAGKACKPNYFVASNQNDLSHGACGLAANILGYKSMAVSAPNYQGGRDAIAGFTRDYKGTIAGEVYTRLDQTDFSVELARIRDLAPQGLYQFHPGGAGINFVKQYGGAGLAEKVPMVLGPYAMDARMIGATGSAATGLYMAGAWSPLLDNSANAAFVAAFKAAYNRLPTVYAAQCYDTARLIGSALKVSGPDLVANADAFRSALRAAKFDSVRGRFAFSNNQNALLDYWLMQIEPAEGGLLMPKVLKRIGEQVRDPYTDACSLPPV